MLNRNEEVMFATLIRCGDDQATAVISGKEDAVDFVDAMRGFAKGYADGKLAGELTVKAVTIATVSCSIGLLLGLGAAFAIDEIEVAMAKRRNKKGK